MTSNTDVSTNFTDDQLSRTVSKLIDTLSWILTNVQEREAHNPCVTGLYADLEDVHDRLRRLAEHHLPPTTQPVAKGKSNHALREIGQNPKHRFTYCSPKMHEVMANVERAAKRNVPILLTGETGVGKELIARFIHMSSTRSHGPMVPVNCSAIPRELFENHFFGHTRGAFTGAIRNSPGVIRSASGGTLFLDEIGELPVDQQPKLLRFLQEAEVQAVGECIPARVDVRIVAATNQNLESEVEAGRFRADLLHRLKAISFDIPPLRERPEDIPLLLSFFLDEYSNAPAECQIRFAPETVQILTEYPWPGNVRELSSLVLRTVSLNDDVTVILPSDLPLHIVRPAGASGASKKNTNDSPNAPHQNGDPVHNSAVSLGEAVTRLERQKIRDALQKNNWSYSKAARDLGMSTYGLRKKFRRLFSEESSSTV